VTAPPQGDDLVKVVCPKCPQCGEAAVVLMTADQFEQMHRQSSRSLGMIFPTWTKDQRELLITGLHAKCWDAFLGPEEED
jgi:hypothetical protein